MLIEICLPNINTKIVLKCEHMPAKTEEPPHNVLLYMQSRQFSMSDFSFGATS